MAKPRQRSAKRPDNGESVSVLDQLTGEERRRRRLRLWLCLPLNVLLLGVSLTSILVPSSLYNTFHVRDLKDGEKPITLGIELRGGLRTAYQVVREQGISDDTYLEDLARVEELLRERIASYGNLEPNVSLDSEAGVVLVELPGVENKQAIANLISKTGRLELSVISEEAKSLLKPGDRLLPSQVVATLATRREIAKATIESEGPSRDRYVKIEFKQNVAESVQRKTAQYRDRHVAITVSGELHKIVHIDKNYSGGAGATVISSEGGMSEETVADYERLFNWQALPADLRQLESQFVSPELGKEQLLTAYVALVLGAVLVIILMLLFYGTFLGSIGSLGLVFCAILVWGGMNAIGGVLTLAGMAGFLLTIGISVDSFILIFEAIKDDIRNRVKAKLQPFDEDAIWEQTRRVVRRLVALRLTTAVAAIVLLFGDGPVRSFAATLLIGLAAEWIVASRPVIGGLMILLLKHGTSVSRSTYGVPIFQSTRVENLISRALKKSGAVARTSIVVAVVLVILIYIYPPPLGLDFGGGLQIDLRLDKEVDRHEVLEEISKAGLSGSLLSVQRGILAADEEEVSWLLSFRKSHSDADDAEQKLENSFPDGVISGSWNPGPRVPFHELLRWFGLVAIAIAGVGLFCLSPWSRISVRGRRLVPALAVMGASVHDLVFVGGILSLSRVPIDQPALIGLLVVVGYSLNDSLVLIWHLGDEEDSTLGGKPRYRKESVEDGIVAIRSRTLNTTATTLAAVLPVALFTGASFRGYAVTVIGGVAIGTFSSLFLVGWWMSRFVESMDAKHSSEPEPVPVDI